MRGFLSILFLLLFLVFVINYIRNTGNITTIFIYTLIIKETLWELGAMKVVEMITCITGILEAIITNTMTTIILLIPFFSYAFMMYTKFLTSSLAYISTFYMNLTYHNYNFLYGDALITYYENSNLVYYVCVGITYLFILLLRILVWGLYYAVFIAIIYMLMGNSWWVENFFYIWYWFPILGLPLWTSVWLLTQFWWWIVDEMYYLSVAATWILFVIPYIAFYLLEEYHIYLIEVKMNSWLWLNINPDNPYVRDWHRTKRRKWRIVVVSLYVVWKTITAFIFSKFMYKTFYTLIMDIGITFVIAIVMVWLMEEYWLYIKKTYIRIRRHTLKRIYWYIHFSLYYPPKHPFNFLVKDIRKILGLPDPNLIIKNENVNS